MPFLTDKSPVDKLRRKRLYGDVEYEGCSSPQKSNSSKVNNTLGHALAPIAGGDIQTENSIVGTKTENSLAEPKVAVKNIENGFHSGGFGNVGENCPAPKIREGVSVFRQFPLHCGRENYVLSSKPNVLGIEKSLVEQRTIAQRNDKQNRGEMKSKCNSLIFANNDEYLLQAKGSNDRFNDYKAVISCNKVREALNQFEKTYEKLLKENKAKPDKRGKAAWPLLVEAAEDLKQQDKWVNTEENFVGAVPGIEVGDRFNFRVELAIIGLHRQYYVGIAYVYIHEKSYATSIVDSGRYIKEAEYSDVLIYSGQGGNPALACKKLEDQKLKGGNLALKNSMDAKSPVRVIRGYQSFKASSPKSISSEKKTYIYDGLYIVTKCSQERGRYGKLVFMFHLERIKGQPKLVPFEPAPIKVAPIRVNQSRKSIDWHENCVVDDISQGKEKNPIRVMNDIDDDKPENCVIDDISQGKEKNPIRAMNEIDDDKPPVFNYITDMMYPELNDFSMPRSCDCINGCSDFIACSCMVKNGSELPFDDNGTVIKAKPVIYECGPLCKCPPMCKNRVSQRGVEYKLEIFKTESSGWGVRSQRFISAGRFICEYVGEVVRDDEAGQWAGKDEYSIGIGTNKNGFQYGNNEFMIDAVHFGNVGRFIKHSCMPNLFVQNVLYDHEDDRMPHVMLFSSENIPRSQELTCDFNYKMG